MAIMQNSEKVTQSQIIEDLVRAAADGDKAAANQLMARYGSIIREAAEGPSARAAALLQQRGVSQADTFQEAAMRILQSLPRHAWQGRSAFIAWLKTLSRAAIIDQARWHGAQKRRGAGEVEFDEGQFAPSGPGLETHADLHDRMAALERAMSHLSREERLAVMLPQYGFSHAQVGEVLECTAEAARKRQQRGEQKLTKLLR